MTGDLPPTLLHALPERGWGVLRASPVIVAAYTLAGLIKAHTTPTPGVYEARLTGAGRERRRAEPPVRPTFMPT